jgi:hypothetical protein
LPKAMRVKRGCWRFYSRNYTLGEFEVTDEWFQVPENLRTGE